MFWVRAASATGQAAESFCDIFVVVERWGERFCKYGSPEGSLRFARPGFTAEELMGEWGARALLEEEEEKASRRILMQVSGCALRSALESLAVTGGRAGPRVWATFTCLQAFDSLPFVSHSNTTMVSIE